MSPQPRGAPTPPLTPHSVTSNLLLADAAQWPVLILKSSIQFIPSAVTGEHAGRAKESIYRSSRFRSWHFVPLPQCQSYELAPHPALLSFAWMHLKPPTRFHRPLEMGSTRRNPDVNGVRAVCSVKSSLGTYWGSMSSPSLSPQFSFPHRKLGKDISAGAVWWFPAHARSAKENGKASIPCYWLIAH